MSQSVTSSPLTDLSALPDALLDDDMSSQMLDHRLAAVEEQDESDNDGSTDKLKRKRGRPFKNSEKDKTVDGVVLPDRKRPVPLASVNSLDRSGRSLVFRYAARGDYSTTRALIEAGADLSIKDYAGWTALHEACLAGHSRVVELLLMHGALVDARGGDGDTPLHDAVGNGHVSVVQLLLRYGASYELVGESGLTPLEFANANVESLAEEPSNAASQEDIGSVAKELKMSENFDSSSLKAADLNWSGGNSAVVEETEVDQVLLNSNSSNNNSNSKNSKNENAASGSVMGGNVNFGDEQLAARQIVSILQDWKIMTAEVVKRDEFGQTILHMAAKDGDLQRLSDLLWYGADVNAADNIGWTPLHDSALGGHAECLNKLLAFGALPNSTSKEKSTPLSDAAANGHYQCVHILLQYGALVPKDLISSFDSNLSESHLKCHRLLDRPSHSWMPHTTSEYHPKKYNPEQAVSPSDDAKPDHAEPAPNPFAWGGLDPNHGTFESSREEKKFQALWKTLEGTQGNGKAHLKRKPESSDDENGHIAQVETKIAKKGPGRGRPRRQPSESKLEDDISLPDIKSEVEAPISSSNMPINTPLKRDYDTPSAPQHIKKPKLETSRSGSKVPALKQIRQESSASQQTRQESSTSLISEAESINRPRKKKKSWLGISGYQRLSEDGSRDISAEDSQQLIRSPSPISEVAVSGQSSKLNHGDWATDKGSISMRRNSTESSLPLKVNPAFHIPHLDVHINQLHPCVPLYTYVLPHAPEYLQGQRWCVDFQVALFLGLKSGRQLLDKYPTLSRRVLTGNEKRVLEQSTLAYAILEGIIHNGQSLKWLRLKSLDIGRGLALSSVDMHFIPLQQVLMLQELVEKRNTHVLKSKWDGLVLECTMRTDGISAVDLANVDELMGLPVREPIKESRKVQYIHKLKRK